MYELEKRPVWIPEGGNNYFLPYQESPRALEKLARELHPEVERWLRTWQANARYQVVVIAPMGASEVWGCNSNGDWFSEEQLNPKGTTAYGYKTFEKANLFEHHANKNPALSRGRIPLAVWNDRMRRVEIIAVNDRHRCEELGSSGIVADIDLGKMPPVSMGTRVAYDVCSRCGNKAKTTREYCGHLRHEMGHVRSDGTATYAVNIRPRFFDLSYVHVPAAKESGVLAKVANQQAAYDIYVPPKTVKVAGPKTADVDKSADIDKQVTPNTVRKAVVKPLVRTEAPIPDKQLAGMDGLPLKSILATLGFGGAVLSPREFTILVLRRTQPEMAARVPTPFRLPWTPRASGMTPMGLSDYRPSLFRQLRPVIAQRSFFPRTLSIRIMGLRNCPSSVPSVAPVKTASSLPEETLTKLATMYADYRASLTDSFLQHFDIVCKTHPEVLNPEKDALFEGLTGGASKHAAAKVNFGGLAMLAAPVYLLSAHLQEMRDLEHVKLGEVESFIASNPNFLASVLVNAVRAAL